MAGMLDKLRGFFGTERRKIRPSAWAGSPGFSAYSGYVDEREVDSLLSTHEGKFNTFETIIANTTIVSASLRYFLNLIAKSEWSFSPAEDVADGEMYAERLEEALIESPDTSWHRVMRRAAMFRFYGFSIQEWAVKRHPEGWLTFSDIRHRPARTVERWDTDEETGVVRGMIQLRPQDQMYVYLPREKVLYLVDDALSDSPAGLGILRHMVAPSERLKRYEQLEGYGFEVDLRNIPLARAPYDELARLVESQDITHTEMKARVSQVENFIHSHVRNPKLGMVLDSATYAARDEAERPSATRMWDLELLNGSQTSLTDAATAIMRINREMARIMGTEQLLLGDTEGSYALAQDKTSQFYLLVDSTLVEIRETVQRDLVDMLWMINGWPDEAKPIMNLEAVRSRNIVELSAMLRDMATAGAVLMPQDPVIGQIRDLAGLERPPEGEELEELLRAMAEPEMGGPSDPNEPMPAPEDP